MNEKIAEGLIQSLKDYAYIILEISEALKHYIQMVKDQAEEILQLKAKIKELEGNKDGSK